MLVDSIIIFDNIYEEGILLPNIFEHFLRRLHMEHIQQKLKVFKNIG
jgi:hypothetical protein